MKGDFSAWNKDGGQNFRGALHQQGRVLLDRDWNAQTEIFNSWQDTAGRDAFGAGVAAIPAEVPQSFKVTEAKIDAGAVKLAVNKGRVWADGLLVEAARDMVNRVAPYLNLPPDTLPSPATTPKDAVILETWLEELSPFQKPALLIEPALGGVDTTERVQTAYRFRLYRMDAGDTCESLLPKLKDDFSLKGKLTAKLNPDVTVGGDCPVVESGGYTGFEHRLYRIEIGETNKAGSWFKWSQFNGGLVGTGDFDTVNRKVAILGNINAIMHSGISEFYLEALELDAALGCWRVIYAAKATLGADHMLALPPAADADEFLGSIPPAPAQGKRFFRLWNGIEAVADFVAAEKDLPDLVGIKLKFDTAAADKYTPSDFWTFEVRAAGIGNPTVLIGDPLTFAGFPPQGIYYHRVPLAEVTWSGTGVSGDDIEDCRSVFQPLTKLQTCCSFRVGDGIHSHGDFTRIQDAINALPKVDGGVVCILPGVYEENIVLGVPHNRNIVLQGCGKRSVLRFKTDDPVIHVQYGQNIRIAALAVEAHDNGTGIFLEGEEKSANNGNQEKYLRNIVMTDLFVSAAKDCAIKAHIAQFLTLSNSLVCIKDSDTRKVAVYLAGDDMLVECSEIRVISERLGNTADAASNDPAHFVAAQGAAGGLQIGGGSERVRIVDNLIISGTRNGITLGSIDLLKDQTVITNHDPFYPKGPIRDCCQPDDGYVDDGDVTDDGLIPVAGPPLADILIQCNRIFNMGRNGIGVATFFGMGDIVDPKQMDQIELNTVKGMIWVRNLRIIDNSIERCMNIAPQDIPAKMTTLIGYGGIALAQTAALLIRDNSIVDNGPDFLQPVCGIFVLLAEGVEISRNRILNNGARSDQELTNKSVKNGLRGGIYIVRAIAPAAFAGTGMFLSSGFPAAKIQENIVMAPLGRSLTLIANGEVSVVGNQFTSLGIAPINFYDLFISIATQGKVGAAAIMELLSLVAGNVLILNQGRATFIPGAASGYKNIQSGASAGAAGNMTGAGTGSPAAAYYKYFANGNVLFGNNQCRQNLLTAESSFSLSSIFIASLDDVGFHDNQCDCELADDFLLVNALLFGITTRASDNKFSESLLKVLLSAATFGMQNITTDNESVHCLLVLGTAYLSRHNLVLLELGSVNGDVAEYTDAHPCDRLRKLFGAFGSKMLANSI